MLENAFAVPRPVYGRLILTHSANQRQRSHRLRDAKAIASCTAASIDVYIDLRGLKKRGPNCPQSAAEVRWHARNGLAILLALRLGERIYSRDAQHCGDTGKILGRRNHSRSRELNASSGTV